MLAVKVGGEGTLGHASGEFHHGAPLPVRQVDPIGAGDAVDGGFLAGRC